MKRLVISDLHLGSTFSREEMLISLLKEKEFDELILAGDIIEFLKVPRFVFCGSPSSGPHYVRATI